jgi:hypothetical protein
MKTFFQLHFRNTVTIMAMLGAFVACLSFVPGYVSAADIKFNVIPNTTASDAATQVEVRIDPQSKNLNVVEGTIVFKGPIAESLSVQVENGQSVLSLWPTPPVYNTVEKSIQFTGGIPLGFTTEGLLLRMRLSASESGDVDISYVPGGAYINDGKGTQESIPAKSITVHVGTDEYTKSAKSSEGSRTLGYGILILLIVAVLSIILQHVYKKYTKK